MTRELRYRIIALQAVLVIVFAFCAGFLFWGSGFVNGMIHDQLAAQKIYFPAKDSPATTALPAADAAAMQRYAGQQLTTGDQAEVYADHFIRVHLNEAAGGKTYAEVSAAAQANPQDQKLAGQVQTLFRGETLRGLLLNAWGWSQVAMYALYAGIVLTLAALVVLGALIFEVLGMRRSAPELAGQRVVGENGPGQKEVGSRVTVARSSLISP
ncbi:MAG: hypothetical protein ACR2MZ_00085 [Candidatus Dormibacter sp.]|uniref:hypothetical protein n=1 Tax=Candidatus Dormibacter sp. TaxID=2973982 RepID=UPI000DB58E5C|nr:MAG: hypothetical protein DLM66_09290 [Candidatus Dormibacteraeota bacterium]